MNKKYIRRLLIIILIFTLSIPIISYAISMQIEKDNMFFLTADKEEVGKGEKVVLSLNLDLIEYQTFEFTLTSDTNLDNVSTEQKGINISNDKSNFKIIADKSNLSVNQIDLYYQIPEDIEIGTKINLIGEVKEYKNEIIENEKENKTEVVNDEESEEEKIEENKLQKVTITITVVEKENDNLENKDMNKEQDINNNTNKEQNNQNKTSILQETQKTSYSNFSGNIETNTYNGESNNYLDTLKISGYDITPKFTKTNTTYFIEVEKDIDKINITANAEDENAKVNIYGNNNLENGENKVLISVTAENGEVKTYRIYVTKK